MRDPQRFDAFAVAYDRGRTLLDEPTWPSIAALGVPEGGRALDVGCGAGHRSVDLALHMDAVIAIDCSAPLIELARARRPHPNVDFRCADLRNFQDADGFDLVYSANTLHHVEELAPALEHLSTLLRPGGWAVLTDNVERGRRVLTWIWGHGGYHLAALRAAPRARHAGLRGMWELYRFQTSRPWVDHLRSDRYLAPREFEVAYLAAFPGGTVQHDGFATLVWQRPA